MFWYITGNDFQRTEPLKAPVDFEREGVGERSESHDV